MAGQLRVDEITDEAGTGSPDFVNGIQVQGTTFTNTTLGGNYVMQTFNGPATWTKPAGLKAVKVTVVGGGGNGGAGVAAPFPTGGPKIGANGGGGGAAIRYIPAPSIPGPVTVIQGTASSKTSSFGAFLSATGGTDGASPTIPAPAPIGPYAGGAGISGDLNFVGQAGRGLSNQLTENYGGASGMGFAPTTNAVEPVLNGASYGGGATGRVAVGAGGVGGDGVVIVEEFY